MVIILIVYALTAAAAFVLMGLRFRQARASGNEVLREFFQVTRTYVPKHAPYKYLYLRFPLRRYSELEPPMVEALTSQLVQIRKGDWPPEPPKEEPSRRITFRNE